jgi:formylglycine-generating enzyme required for sulfatase activity
MSPEQFNQARSVDGRADVYSVGVVLFKLLTGRVPFDGGWFEIMSAHLSNPPPSPKSLNPDIPERLEQVVLKALEKNPDQRYATCKDFAAAIEPIRWELTEETVLVKPLAPRGNKPKVPLIDEAALERLRKNQDRTPMMLDLDLLPDLIIVGGYYIEGGIRDFAVWSRQMIEELGEGIQPYLERVWDEAHARLGLPIFVRIPVGDFQMGSNSGSDDERPVHKVRIRQVFEMGKYPVTQAQWEAVMGEGENPSYFKGADRPVETVSWTDAQGFIRKLNELDDRYEYRLPTEAEWEYACRAGSTGDYPRQLDEVAWYEKNSGGETHPVGKKKPNAWGLTDMHGNVWEWVQDWYGVYPDKRVTGPQGPVSGSGRVARGGAWSSEAQHCRSTHRLRIAPVSRSSVLGFRLVRTAR